MPCSFSPIVRCWLTHTELLQFWHYSGYGSVCHSSLRNIFLSASHNIDTVCIHAQMHLTLWSHGLYSPQGSSVHGISQAGILELVAFSYSRGSSWSRDWTQVFCVSSTGRQILYHCSTTCPEFSPHFKIFFLSFLITSMFLNLKWI